MMAAAREGGATIGITTGPIPPALVLLPGLDGTGILFRPILEALPPGFDSFVVAYPGDERLDYPGLLEIVRRSLPTDHPYVLLGESFSGPLAILAAATQPPGLVGLVLCASFARCPHPYLPRWLARAIRPSFFRLFPLISGAKAVLGGYATAALRDLSAEALSRVSPPVMAHRLRSILRVDVRAELAACPVPILYLRGTRDLVVPAHNLGEVRRIARSVRFARIGAPHMVLQTRPREAVASIVEFMATLGGA